MLCEMLQTFFHTIMVTCDNDCQQYISDKMYIRIEESPVKCGKMIH